MLDTRWSCRWISSRFFLCRDLPEWRCKKKWKFFASNPQRSFSVFQRKRNQWPTLKGTRCPRPEPVVLGHLQTVILPFRQKGRPFHRQTSHRPEIHLHLGKCAQRYPQTLLQREKRGDLNSNQQLTFIRKVNQSINQSIDESLCDAAVTESIIQSINQWNGWCKYILRHRQYNLVNRRITSARKTLHAKNAIPLYWSMDGIQQRTKDM